MVVGAGLLLMVLAGYIGYAHYLRQKLKSGLEKYGIHVTQESDHVTFSKSNGDRTIFTVRAAKQIQHEDGKTTLRDVGIVLYGAKGDRSDRIHGEEFEYDQKNQVMTAAGEVFIDLAPPVGTGGTKPAKADDETRILHLKTMGLVFRQQDQVAETDGAIEFMVQGMNGTAVGASYDSGNGIIVLRSQVRVSGLRGKVGATGGGERPMVLTASHAEIDMEDGPPDAKEAGNVAFLDAVKLVEATDSGTETATAVHAVVHMSADGTPKHVVANGNVTLTGEGRGTVTSDQLDLDLSVAGQPTAAHLFGVVRFVNDMEARQEYGKANDARVAFDKEGRPVHAVMTGEVEADLTAGTSVRWLGADKLELALAGGGKVPVVVRSAEATAADGAHMRLVDATTHKDAKGKAVSGILTTNVRADLLTALLEQKGKKTEVIGVDGTGRTVVERTLVDSVAGTAAGPIEWKETGTGDVLRMDFKDDAKGKTVMSRAEQRGSVKLVREAMATPDEAKRAAAKGQKAGPDIQHAEGDTAAYLADENLMTMDGRVKVSDSESALFADQVRFDRGTGEATAEGAVRVSYLEQGSTGEPVHVMSARAVAHKTTGVSEFYAGAGGPAKMWQGGSQVAAPVIEFDRTKKTVTAHGAKGAEGQVVKTVLVDSGKAKPAETKKQGTSGPVRVLSREMVYTDATRQVFFRGPVQVNDQDGTMRSQEATVYLVPKDAAAGPTHRDDAATNGAQSEIALGGRVDHIVGVGAVEMDQPGRKANGERLVYTASDRTFVLTGTKAAPPKIVDETQGTVTGASLRFRTGDDSVEVQSGDGMERVHTETRMKQKDR